MAFKGLRQLLTDQGSEYRVLRFGKDRPEGGDSGQPFIQQKLPPAEKPLESSWPDFLIRDPKNAINNRVDDLERIGKFLITPAGLQFIAKQELLSLQNPIVPGRPNRTNPVAGLYYPYMTLGQVGLSGTGIHIEKQGASPIFDNKVEYATQYPLRFSEENANRLVLLYESTISGNGLSSAQQLNAAKVGVSTNSNFLLSYLGGPNVGINGKTTIGFASDRRSPEEMREIISESLTRSKDAVALTTIDFTGSLGVSKQAVKLGYASDQASRIVGLGAQRFPISNQDYLDEAAPNTNLYYRDLQPNGKFSKVKVSQAKTNALGVFTLPQQELLARTPIGRTGETSLSNIRDFRSDILEVFTTPQDKILQDQLGLYSFDYLSATVNREQRVGLGNPGKRTRRRGKLTEYDNATVDRINMLPLYYDNIVLDPNVLTRDLVKFRFEVIDNANPTFSTFIHFRAFLGAITDNFKADWQTTKYIGRGENFYNYTGFSRDISFSFKVHPQSRAEMKSIYQKLQFLASSLAPDYTNGYMKGNLVRLTIGDYLYIVPGFISSLTYNIPEEAPWEISLTEPEGGVDTGTMETPKLFEVNVSFTPIHDFVPQVGNNKETALITPARATNAYLDKNIGTNVGINNKTYDFNITHDEKSGNFTFNSGSTGIVNGKDTVEAINLRPFATGELYGVIPSPTPSTRKVTVEVGELVTPRNSPDFGFPERG